MILLIAAAMAMTQSSNREEIANRIFRDCAENAIRPHAQSEDAFRSRVDQQCAHAQQGLREIFQHIGLTQDDADRAIEEILLEIMDRFPHYIARR